jgi:hypothetical protein
MPTALLNKLPPKAKALWEKVYGEKKGELGSERAAILAMAVVKKSYKKNNNKWVAKSAAIKLKLIKSGWLFPQYKFKIILSSSDEDKEFETINPNLLEDLVKSDRIEKIGDVDHEIIARELNSMDSRSIYTNDVGTNGLYYLDNVEYSDGKVIGTVVMNNKHPLFDKYLNLHKQGKYLHASAEFEDPVYNGNNQLINASKMGWTITDNPTNPVARALEMVE